jgi:hypothetical protein
MYSPLISRTKKLGLSKTQLSPDDAVKQESGASVAVMMCPHMAFILVPCQKNGRILLILLSLLILNTIA